MRRGAARRPKRVGLALQGGGALGAFTWGVLDALLEDGRVSFDAISGTSAGAINAVVMADGLRRGGPEMARVQLRRLWQGLSLQNAGIAALDESTDALLRLWRQPGAGPYETLLRLSPLFSPYNFNPFNFNPLLGLIRDLVDFEGLRAAPGPRLFVSATNASTGLNRTFSGDEISAEAVMASAALPFLFQAMHIEGEPYWDGGYTGNPSLMPLADAGIRDLLLVQLDPLVKREVPRTPSAILGRIRELTYNVALIHELGAIELMRDLSVGRPRGDGAVAPRIHTIDAARALADDQNHRGLDISWRFIEDLCEAGREAARAWLKATAEEIGRRKPTPAPSRPAKRARRDRADLPPLSLALQGGGGHGAFTWGVLDRLLEAGRFDIRAISGTSAGAANAVIVADGLARGDADRARAQLERFWQALASEIAGFTAGGHFFRALYRQWTRWGTMQNGLIGAGESVVALRSNPLETILGSLVDFERLRRASPVELFLGATNVRTGRSRIFTTAEIDAASVAASACLPFLFPAVEIDGEAYWEGGYSDNPPLRPLLRQDGTGDILLVHVYPRERVATPKTPEMILERIAEITFNNSILKELEAIGHIARLIEEGRLAGRAIRRHRIQRLHPEPMSIDREARRNPDFWPFFLTLRDEGRRAASAFLAGAREALVPPRGPDASPEEAAKAPKVVPPPATGSSRRARGSR